MKIATYKKQENADFFILNKGDQAGKPSLKPWHAGNCFAVNSENPKEDFARVYCAYISRSFYPYLLGTAIPFLRISDIRKVLGLTKHIKRDELSKIYEAEQKIRHYEKVLRLCTELRDSLARKAMQQ